MLFGSEGFIVLGLWLFFFFFEKELKLGCVGRGDDLKGLRGGREYDQNMFSFKNYLIQ